MAQHFSLDPFRGVWECWSFRQIYQAWRVCYTDSVQRHRDRETLHHYILKSSGAWKIDDLPFGRWQAEDEKIQDALYPEHRQARPSSGPVKSQWELYHELVRSGRLAHIEQTRHERSVPFDRVSDVKQWLKSR